MLAMLMYVYIWLYHWTIQYHIVNIHILLLNVLKKMEKIIIYSSCFSKRESLFSRFVTIRKITIFEEIFFYLLERFDVKKYILNKNKLCLIKYKLTNFEMVLVLLVVWVSTVRHRSINYHDELLQSGCCNVFFSNYLLFLYYNAET